MQMLITSYYTKTRALQQGMLKLITQMRESLTIIHYSNIVGSSNNSAFKIKTRKKKILDLG